MRKGGQAYHHHHHHKEIITMMMTPESSSNNQPQQQQQQTSGAAGMMKPECSTSTSSTPPTTNSMANSGVDCVESSSLLAATSTGVVRLVGCNNNNGSSSSSSSSSSASPPPPPSQVPPSSSSSSAQPSASSSVVVNAAAIANLNNYLHCSTAIPRPHLTTVDNQTSGTTTASAASPWLALVTGGGGSEGCISGVGPSGRMVPSSSSPLSSSASSLLLATRLESSPYDSVTDCRTHLTPAEAVAAKQAAVARTAGIYEIPSLLFNRLSHAGSSSSVGAATTGGSSYGAPSKSTPATYMAPRNEYESLIKRYAELDSFHVEVVTKLSMTEAENRQHRKRNEEILQQLNVTMNAREMLQDELNLMVAKYEKACREIRELQEQLIKVKKQRDEANKECNNAMNGRNKAIRERQKMYEERNNAMHDYNLMMSERDSVHKEIEKLQEDLLQSQKRNDTLDRENKLTLEELECLRRELASALLDRDHALRVCQELRDKYGERTPGSLASHQDSQQSLLLLGTGTGGVGGTDYGLNDANTSATVGHLNCSSSSNGSLITSQSPGKNHVANAMVKGGHHLTTSSSTSSVSTFGGCGQIRQVTAGEMIAAAGNSNSSLVNHETENLREQNRTLQAELQRDRQEIETWRNRCDWAVKERDKVVLERESLRALCDELKKEQARKLSDLADALLESYEMKRQNNETSKELEQLRQRLDHAIKANKAGGPGQPALVTGKPPGVTCTSQDSAIDVEESQSSTVTTVSEMELLDIVLKRDQSHIPWGFEFDPMTVTVANVCHDSIASRSGLKAHDQVVKMNQLELMVNAGKASLAKARTLVATTELLQLNLRVRRIRRTPANGTKTVLLPVLSHGNDFSQDDCMPRMLGFTGQLTLLVVNRLSATDTVGAGDRIIAVNGTPLNKILGRYLLQYMFNSADNHSNAVKVQLIRACQSAMAPVECVSPTKAIAPPNVSAEYSTASASIVPDSSPLTPESPPKATAQLPGRSVDSVESEIEEEDEPRTTVDEDNDADEDEPNSDTENESEIKTIAKLDQILDKYQIEDFYASATSQSTAPINHDQPDGCKPSPVVESTAPPPPQVTQPVVRRSSRSKKCNKQHRNTLVAAAYPVIGTLPHYGGSGDTWPRYRPNQSSMLPSSFYKQPGYELQPTKPVAYINNVVGGSGNKSRNPDVFPNYSLTVNQRRPATKQRESLGSFLETFLGVDSSTQHDTLKANTPVVSSNKPTPNLVMENSSVVTSGGNTGTITRRSPRHRDHLNYESCYGAIGTRNATAESNSQVAPTLTGAKWSRHSTYETAHPAASGMASYQQQQPVILGHPNHYFPYQLPTEANAATKISGLQRSLTYNSLKNNSTSGNRSGVHLGGYSLSPQLPADSPYYTFLSGQNSAAAAAAAAVNTYSPVYATYSAVYQQQQQQKSTTADQKDGTLKAGTSASHYGNVSIPLVDYSVVSAQTKDKDVLKYYTMRQSTSAGGGSTGGSNQSVTSGSGPAAESSSGGHIYDHRYGSSTGGQPNIAYYNNLSSALASNIGIPYAASQYSSLLATSAAPTTNHSSSVSANANHHRHSMNLGSSSSAAFVTPVTTRGDCSMYWPDDLAGKKPSSSGGSSISVPTNNRPFNYSLVHDSNRAGGGHHRYSLSENMYASVTTKAAMMSLQQQQQQPPPPPPPSAYFGDQHQCALLSEFNQQQQHPVVTNRIRIPSNSSSVSSTKTNNPRREFFLDNKSFGTAPATNHPVVVNGSNLSVVGDRNSYVSNSGSVAAPQVEVEWMESEKNRSITIYRSSGTLGIRILRTGNDSKGVFVEAVNEGSLAAQAGIKPGDQIIEICGLNMRTADFENAAKVLNQCGDPIKLKVQSNYEKFKEIQAKQLLQQPQQLTFNTVDVIRNLDTNNNSNNGTRVRVPIVGRDADHVDREAAMTTRSVVGGGRDREPMGF